MHKDHGRGHHHDDEQVSEETATLRKLLIMLDHWIDHDHAHAEGFQEWAEKAGAAGEEEVAREIHLAIEGSDAVRGHFKRAKAILAAKLVLRK
jgi:nickel/cobalt exporter